MNRNVESHFSELPRVEIQRSMFDRSSSHKTSFNVGSLIPFYVDEVVAGDTFNVTTSAVVRLQTPLTPIMDNMYMDTYYFFVPYRLCWTHWREFMGENTSSAWLPSTSYSIPTISPPAGGWNVGTIADYMGIPVGVGPNVGRMPSALPFRAYALICDQWFRDQNLTDPLVINTGDSNVNGLNTGVNGDTDGIALGAQPFKVAKYHDVFSSSLPAPQKGPTVSLLANYNLYQQAGYTSNVYAPVYARNSSVPFDTAHQRVSLKAENLQGTADRYVGFDSSTGDSNHREMVWYDTTGSNYAGIAPSNLWADLSAANLTINDLRIAFQLQKFYEKSARAGRIIVCRRKIGEKIWKAT